MKQFLSIREAAEMLDTSEQHIRNLIRGIREHPERYHMSDVVGKAKIAVRFVALQDFANYGNDLEHAPRYNPIAREMELGMSPVVDSHQIAVEVIREAVKTLCNNMEVR